MSGGAYSRNKGARAERDWANHLRVWWPKAERAVRTGYRTATRVSADPGDLTGIPGVIFSVKHVDEKDTRKPSLWVGWWAEVDAMLDGDPAALGVIVERRDQAPDPSTWWVHLRLGDLVALYNRSGGHAPGDRASVRVDAATFIELLIAAGYARGMAS